MVAQVAQQLKPAVNLAQYLAQFRALSAKHGAMIVLGFLEQRPASAGANWYGASVSNAAVIYDRGQEVGVGLGRIVASFAPPLIHFIPDSLR